MSTVIKSELAAAFRQKGFVIALLLVLASALGLNTTMQSVGLYFKKQRVDLRQPLDAIPRMMGPWLQFTKDMPLPEEQEESLGTKDYITRTYLDTRLIKGFDLKRWDAMSDEQRDKAIAVMRQTPASTIEMHCAYYTDLVDTVTHVPERCYVGGGFDPEHPQVLTLDPFKGVEGRNPNLKVKYVEFVDRAQANRMQNVAYCFNVNGAYEYDSFAGVRGRLQDIREKYAYYCKIEMHMQVGDHVDVAQKTMTDLLHYALPELERVLPDWHAMSGEKAALNNEQ